MTIGLVGRKTGMTRVFTDAGDSVPVTVIEVDPNRVTQVKTTDADGYAAVQITVGERRASRVTKAAAGHFAKANTAAGRGLWEMRNVDGEEVSVGDSLTVERFNAGQKVDVTGQSKGKGFQGTIKVHGFHRGPMSHGSKSHRLPGSIGAGTDPARVFKGTKMAKRLGNSNVTIKNLEIIKIDSDNNTLFVKGAVPGNKQETLLMYK